MSIAAIVVNELYEDLGKECVITSGCDGNHRRGSRHYSGEAIDFRTRHLSSTQVDWLKEKAIHRLGPQFDVVMARMPPHIHVEYDPK